MSACGNVKSLQLSESGEIWLGNLRLERMTLIASFHAMHYIATFLFLGTSGSYLGK